MWPPWSRSPVRIHIPRRSNNNIKTTTTTSSSNFAFSSFKDIAAICSEDSTPLPSSPILRRPTPVFHRLYHSPKPTTTLLRTSSTPQPTFLLHPSPPPLKPQLSSDLSQKSNLDPTHVTKSAALPERSQLDEKAQQPISLPGAERRIVIYYTSLRVIRPTFEACKMALTILNGFKVPVDERDLSMDASFLTELKQILNDNTLMLPRVFIGGRYVGGAEEVRQLHECGELKKMVAGLPVSEGGVCEGCGGFRFVLCGECCGSRRAFFEKGGGGFRSCGTCNENGLVMCPKCSFKSPLLPVVEK